MLAAASARAGSYPSKPVRMIVPFAPGGSRRHHRALVAQKLTEELGNRSTSRTTLAPAATSARGRRARGTRWLFADADHQVSVVNPQPLRWVPYDPDKDFCR